MASVKTQLAYFKETMIETKDRINLDHLSLMAAAMSYYILLAFVPFIGSIILLYALFSDPVQVTTQMTSMSEKLPPEVQTIIRDQLSKFISKTSEIRVGAFISLGLTFWFSSNGTSALMKALNIIYEREEKRSIVKFYLTSLCLTISATFLSVLSVGVVIILPSLMSFIPLPDTLRKLIPVASWVILLMSFTGFLSLCYGFGACRKGRYWKKVVIGASSATVFWALASLLFTWYVKSFGQFNKTYGSLGAIVIMMLWFYISSFIIILGGELSATLEKREQQRVGASLMAPVKF